MHVHSNVIQAILHYHIKILATGINSGISVEDVVVHVMVLMGQKKDFIVTIFTQIFT